MSFYPDDVFEHHGESLDVVIDAAGLISRRNHCELSRCGGCNEFSHLGADHGCVAVFDGAAYNQLSALLSVGRYGIWRLYICYSSLK